MTDFDKCRAGYWALSVLEKARQDQTPAADAIRDAMDEPWQRLSIGEQADLRAYSVELSRGEK